jgi:hypothetical protein
LDQIRYHIEQCKKNNVKTREKQRVTNITSAGLKNCKTMLHLRRYLTKSGIYLDLSTTKDGKIFGVTLVDHHTKCVFKASELDGLKASMFESLRLGDMLKEDKSTKEEKTKAEENSNQNSKFMDLAVSALGNESSRRSEDEEMPTKGKRL